MSHLALSLEGLSFSYQDEAVIKSLSLEIEEGEFVGLIGPNGCGKSTLIKLLAGMAAKRGRITILGKEAARLSAKELAAMIAVVPQGLVIPFSFTVGEVVLMGRNPHIKRFAGYAKEDFSAVQRAMELTKTAQFAERKVTELSGGEFQRILIAQALAQETRIILLDEPTSHLDIGYQLEIMELIKELNASKITVLMAIHDLNLAAAYVKRMVFLKEGRIVADGPTEETFNSATIQKTFLIPSVVHKNPLTGRLYVTASAELAQRNSARGKRVHLISGSGSGASLMKDLSLLGYRISGGVLNVLDSDEEVARALGISTALEAPFSVISKEAFQRGAELMGESDAVVLTDVPVGRGNFKNLGLIRPALRAGKSVFILEETPIERRDFTGGRFKRFIDGILEEGAVKVCSKDDLIAALERIEERP